MVFGQRLAGCSIAFDTKDSAMFYPVQKCKILFFSRTSLSVSGVLLLAVSFTDPWDRRGLA